MQRAVFRPIFPHLKTQGFLPLHAEMHAARIRWEMLAKCLISLARSDLSERTFDPIIRSMCG
jgi:hypothetical protein